MRSGRYENVGRTVGLIALVALALTLASCAGPLSRFAYSPPPSSDLTARVKRFENRQTWQRRRDSASSSVQPLAPVGALANRVAATNAGDGRTGAADSGRRRPPLDAERSPSAGDRSCCPRLFDPHGFRLHLGSPPLRYLTLATFAELTEPTSAPHPPREDVDLKLDRDPMPTIASTIIRDIKQMPGGLWQDTKRVYTNPVNLIVLAGAGGAALALRAEVDDDIEDKYDRSHSFSQPWRDTFGALGNPGTHFAVAGAWYLIGAQQQQAKTYQVGRTLFNALIINDLSTMLLKVACNTESPNGENLAFPSGHVSSTACLAAVMHEAYGPWVGVPLYGLTGLVAVERMDDREHSFSDVVFGAALGWVVGHTVATGHRPEIFGGELVPYADPIGRTSGLAWVKSF